jgi:thioredoxin 1
VKIGKLNTDENPRIPSMHGISSIPTILMFKGGIIVDKFVGVVPKAKLSSSITTNL